MEDIRLEKTLEAMLDQMTQTIGPKKAERCPCILLVSKALDRLKSTNNAEIVLELDMLPEADSACPSCRRC